MGYGNHSIRGRPSRRRRLAKRMSLSGTATPIANLAAAVDWTEDGMRNLGTTGRGYWGFRISHLTRNLTSGSTTIYIGVNNTVFKPNVLKEQGEVAALLDQILETVFIGSVPKNPNKQDVEH